MISQKGKKKDLQKKKRKKSPKKEKEKERPSKKILQKINSPYKGKKISEKGKKNKI